MSVKISAELKLGFGLGGVIERTLPNYVPQVPLSVNSTHEKWMVQALLEAMNGVGWSAPNPSVGCVIVHQEKIIARGFTQAYRDKHAERMAFESLQKNFNLDLLSDLTVYVTLEPCSHTGNQPPCVDLLLHSSVKTVVIACGDPDERVSGRGIQKLKDAGKVVVEGVLKNEATAWHFPFLKSRVRKGPLWVAKWAENREGYLADLHGNSKWITNESSRAYTHWLRQKYDAILVGAGTWLKDSPKLTVRDCALPHRRDPKILIFDPKGLIESRSVSPFSGLSLSDFVKAVESTDFGFELQSIFCEGGAHTLNALFQLKKIDLVHRFVGDRPFAETAPAHRITAFHPESKDSGVWMHAASHNFGNDHLQEWINCS